MLTPERFGLRWRVRTRCRLSTSVPAAEQFSDRPDRDLPLRSHRELGPKV